MAVRKTRKPAAKSRKRKSTAEPKRIINRKKQTARKATGATREARLAAREKAAKQKLAKDSKDKDRAEWMQGRGKSVKEIAEALSTTPARIRKLLREASVNPKDKVVGTDAEVAKQIVKLRNEGASWPSIRVRTGMSGAKIRSLYAEAGGKGSTGRAKKAATAKPKATRKSGAARKAAASKAKPKAAARSKRSATKAKAAVKEDAAPSGRTQGRRARRAGLRTFLEDVVWNLDTDNDEVKAGLEGHTIEVSRDFNGRKMRPTEHVVVQVKDIQMNDTEGRVIEYVDDSHMTRFVSSREISALK